MDFLQQYRGLIQRIYDGKKNLFGEKKSPPLLLCKIKDDLEAIFGLFCGKFPAEKVWKEVAKSASGARC